MYCLNQFVLFQVFKNNDLYEGMLLKKRKFLKPERVSEMKRLVGEDVDFPAEFDAIDENSDGKISFSDLSDWALQKSLEIEIQKKKEADAGKAETDA